jgi:hypothetical protein
MQIPEVCLEKLRAAGLVVGEPFPAEHVAWPDGRTIGKPESVRGNSVMGWRAGWGLGPIVLDAPAVCLCWRGGRWVVEVSEWVPGPGPGDFTREFDTPEEAVSDILDYYFGDASRMAPFNRRKQP